MELDNTLPFPFMHMFDKLFGASCSIQRLFLSHTMLITVSLLQESMLCLVKQQRERYIEVKSSKAETRVSMCDTFTGLCVIGQERKTARGQALQINEQTREEMPKFWLHMQIS